MNRRLLPALSLVTGAMLCSSVAMAQDNMWLETPTSDVPVLCATSVDPGFVATIEDRSNDTGFVATAVDISNDSGFLQPVDPSADGTASFPCPTMSPLPDRKP